MEPAPVDTSNMSEDEKLKEEIRLAKLAKLTGRKTSLMQLQTYLNANSAEEAQENGQRIVTSDKLKKVFGERPEEPLGQNIPPAVSEE